MAQIDDVLSLMERMDNIDKKVQKTRAKRMDAYKNSKPSKDYYKRRANEQLHKDIKLCNCNYEQFKSLIEGAQESNYSAEERQEIHETICNLLSNKNYFDKYCTDNGLSAEAK